jgi:hypothetical protein
MALTLTRDERTELERRVRSLKIRAEDARRARVILMLAGGASYSTIEVTVPCYRDYINRWRRRFVAKRLDGLRPQYRGQPPPDGTTHIAGSNRRTDDAQLFVQSRTLRIKQFDRPRRPHWLNSISPLRHRRHSDLHPIFMTFRGLQAQG